MVPRLLITLFSSTFTLIVATSTGATTITFTKIADTSTTIPGTTETFTGFGQPAIDSNTVTFWGGNGVNQQVSSIHGIFVTTIGQSPQFIAQGDVTAIPGAPLVNNEPQTFTQFGNPVISNGQVAFYGTNHQTPVNIGNYTYSSGNLTRVVDQQIAIPGGSGVFSAIHPPWINSGNVVFFGGDGSTQEGVYTAIGGGLQLVANLGTSIPDGSGDFFTSLDTNPFSQPAIVDGTVMFRGEGPNGKEGLYSSEGGTLSAVVDTDTVRPDTGTVFPSILRFGFDGTTVALESENRIYKVSGSDIQLVADLGLVSPLVAPESVASIGNPVIDNGNIAFLGWNTFNNFGALFAELNETLTKILASNDPLDGKTVANSGFPFMLWEPSMSGNRVAFAVQFADGTSGVYVAEITPDLPHDGDLAPRGAPDGIINVADYLIALQIVIGQIQPTADELVRGDLYPPSLWDGVIDTSDLILLLSIVQSTP